MIEWIILCIKPFYDRINCILSYKLLSIEWITFYKRISHSMIEWAILEKNGLFFKEKVILSYNAVYSMLQCSLCILCHNKWLFYVLNG